MTDKITFKRNFCFLFSQRGDLSFRGNFIFDNFSSKIVSLFSTRQLGKSICHSRLYQKKVMFFIQENEILFNKKIAAFFQIVDMLLFRYIFQLFFYY